MYSSCLVASKFVLRKINSSVWFVQTFLQKMFYIAKPPNFPYTSSTVNMLIMNQFHTHSQNKQNPTKKENQIRSNWDRAAEEKVRSERRRDRAAQCCDRQAARCYDRRSAQCDRRTGARFVVAGKVSSSSLFAIWALSLSHSLSLLVRWGVWFSGSLSLLHVEGNGLKVKWICKMISRSNEANFGQTEIIFRKFYFP